MSTDKPELKKYVKPALKLVELAGRRVQDEQLSRLLELEAQPAPTSTSNVQGGTLFPGP
jgi:hypothetical protein